MRLLFLAPAPPCPDMGGGALRMYNMLRFLGQRFRVDLVAPALEGEGVARRLLHSYCADLEFVPPAPRRAWRRAARLGPYEKDPAMALAIGRRLAAGHYGAVHVEKPAMLPYLPARLGRPIVLDTFAYGLTGAVRALRNEPGPLTRARNLLRLLRFAAFDAFCWPATHCVVVVSEVDRQRCLRSHPGRRVLVVPNGVDCTTIRPGPTHESGRAVLLFTGDMSFDPNVQAACALVAQVLPRVRRVRPEVELRLVGRNPHPRVLALEAPGVVVTGEVPEMLPYLQAATVYAAPLQTGAGTRTKLLEAMAAGLPVVTTRVGLEGIEAADGREVVIADDPEAAAAAILRLLGDPAARHRVGGAARQLAEEKYDWNRCLAPIEELYTELLPLRAS